MATRKKSTSTAKSTGKKTKKQNSKSTGAKKNMAGTGRGAGSSVSFRVRNEVKLLIVCAFVILCMLSVFGLCGVVGDVISSVLFGVFGILGYIIPILVFIAAICYVSNVGNAKAMVKLGAAVIAVLDLCGLIQMIVVRYDSTNTLANAYARQSGGGFIGGAIQMGLCKTFGVVGAYILIVLILLICVVMITEYSIIDAIRRGGSRAYQNAREDYAYQKERNEERRVRREEERLKREQEEQRKREQKAEEEEKKKLRSEHKVRGVAIGTKVVDEENDWFSRVEALEQASAEAHDTSEPQITMQEQPEEKSENDALDVDFDIRWNDENSREQDDEYILMMEEEEHPQKLNFLEDKVEERVLQFADEDEEEEKEFVPKEKIEVSASAMEEMRRKPFSYTSPAAPQNENEAQAAVTSDDSAEIKNEEVIPEKKPEPTRPYVSPSIDLLNQGRKGSTSSDYELKETAMKLQETLKKFGVNVTITDVSRGPSVTRYELLPEPGTRVSKITSLTDDIKLNLAATDIRMEAPIPGKSAIGIEVPNQGRDTVYLRELIESQEFKNHPSKIAFTAGKDIAGKVIVGDIAKMPHMLVAGTTGSGKSVFTNSIIMSILFRAKPSEVKLIIVDPKVVEFGVYNGIPHLLIPVVTDPRKAAGALSWAVAEMSKRYKQFADENVRDLRGYNDKIEREGLTDEEGKPLEKLPQIVIIIDELADLMMVAAKEVEESICRLAQLARAAGIHLVIATQRPSVDVVTGLIKANIPSRVALLVSSGTDSRTIIDMNGAEKLLGNGDMLFAPSGYVKPIRVQGAFVSDEEVQRVVRFLTSQAPQTEYNMSLENHMSAPTQEEEGPTDDRDAYFEQAGRFVIEKDKASVSMIQRMFKVGFNRAARIMDQLAEAGVVGEEVGTKPRKVLMSMDEFEQILKQ